MSDQIDDPLIATAEAAEQHDHSETKAVTIAPDDHGQPWYGNPTYQGGAGVMFVASIITAILRFRRRLSNDNNVIAKERGEITFVENLQQQLLEAAIEASKQKKYADEAHDQRNKMVEEVGRLRATTEFQKQLIDQLQKRVRSLERRLNINFGDTDVFPESQFTKDEK